MVRIFHKELRDILDRATKEAILQMMIAPEWFLAQLLKPEDMITLRNFRDRLNQSVVRRGIQSLAEGRL